MFRRDYETANDRRGIEYATMGFIESVAGAKSRHAPTETKFASAADSLGLQTPTLQGWACVFGKVHSFKSDDSNIDVFMRGAFASSLTSGKQIRLTVMHAGIGLLATNRDGLELIEDDYGLAFRCALPETPHAADVAADVLSGKFAEMSPGYRPVRAEIKTIDGTRVRLLYEVDLAEISIVSSGAVPGTRCLLVDGAKRRLLRDEVKTGNITTRDAVDHARLAKARAKTFDALIAALEAIPDRIANFRG